MVVLLRHSLLTSVDEELGPPIVSIRKSIGDTGLGCTTSILGPRSQSARPPGRWEIDDSRGDIGLLDDQHLPEILVV